MFSEENSPASASSRSLDHSMWHMLGVYRHSSTQKHPILSWRTRIKSPVLRKTILSFCCVRLPAGLSPHCSRFTACIKLRCFAVCKPLQR